MPDAEAPHPEHLDSALVDLGEAFDIGRDDLDRLMDSVRRHADSRRKRDGAAIPPRQP